MISGKRRLTGDTGGKRKLDRNQVRLLRDEGLGPSEIAQRFGCSRMQVIRILAEAA
ncbi:MAG: helix-turn-helix domain-containing protein [Devosia sp.]